MLNNVSTLLALLFVVSWAAPLPRCNVELQQSSDGPSFMTENANLRSAKMRGLHGVCTFLRSQRGIPGAES